MSDGNSHDLSKQALVECKLRLDDAVRKFSQSQAFGAGQREIASHELHTAVIELWWKMRYHLQDLQHWDGVEDIEEIDVNYIWRGIHPQTGQVEEIQGLGDLHSWIARTEQVEVGEANANSYRSETSETIHVRLPAEAALQVASLLVDIFHDNGWGPETNKKGELYKVGNRDNFEEPVKDGIPKPK